MKKLNTIAEMEKLKRQESIREKMLCGLTNQDSLAVVFGVTQAQISRDVDDIYNQILQNNLVDHEAQKTFRIAQFENLGRMALVEFEKSKKPSKEKVITKKPCPNCLGEGETEELPGLFDTCNICKGKGQIQTEEVIRIKASKGDPAYYRVFHSCLVEIARINGLYPRNAYSRKLEFEAESVGGKIKLKAQELFLEADSKLILDAVTVLDQLQESVKTGEAKVIESKSKKIEQKNPLEEEYPQED